MKYDAEKNRIIVSCRELVRGARRGICATLPRDEDEPSMEGAAHNVTPMCYEFEIDDYAFLLTVEECVATDEGIYLNVPVDSSPRRPRKEVVEQARGEGYIAAFVLAESTKDADVEIRYLYTNRQTGEEDEIYERVSAKKLRSFFEKCKMSTIRLSGIAERAFRRSISNM